MSIQIPVWLGSQLLLVGLYAGQVMTNEAMIETGKRELAEARFSAAVDSFRKAAELDPNSATAYSLLARALVGEVPFNLRIVPDVDGVLPKAEIAAKKAVDLAPLNASGWCVLGIVDHKLADAARDPRTMAADLNAADQAFKRALSIDATSFEAHYELGKMAFDMAMEPLLEAVQRSGVPVGKLGRIQDPQILKTTQDRYSRQVNDGIDHIHQALKVDPTSWNAMHQMAGLFNERSLMADNDDQLNVDRNLAGDWEKKAEAARPKVAAKAPSPEQLAHAAAMMNLLSGPSFLPSGSQSGTMLVVLPEVAEKSLIKKVDPVYPEAARQAGITGYVQFRIWVDKEGRVKDMQLLSGDPQLANSAREAVRQWEFKPVVLNGERQEFMTTAVLRFVP